MSFIGVQMARHLGAAGRVVEEQDKGVTVRPSSSANFYVDSLDKPAGQTTGDFIINKNQSLFNGFFHRIAVSEVVMDWGIPNVADWWGNTKLVVYLVAGGVVTGPFVGTLDDGFYTAQDALVQAVSKVNSAIGGPPTLSVGTSGTLVEVASVVVGTNFLVFWSQTDGVPAPAVVQAPYTPSKSLARAFFASNQLYSSPPGAAPPPAASPLFTTSKLVQSPLLLGTRYVDIVSPQLTYNQDLKDSTTSITQRDVLYRWYLAWDTIPGNDSLSVGGGNFIQTFPVFQGYRPYLQRRALPYPKQILWNADQPIGQVAFQSYDDRGRLIDTSKFGMVGGVAGAGAYGNYQFQLSTLLSEN